MPLYQMLQCQEELCGQECQLKEKEKNLHCYLRESAARAFNETGCDQRDVLSSRKMLTEIISNMCNDVRNNFEVAELKNSHDDKIVMNELMKEEIQSLKV